MNIDACYQLGQVVRTHGTKGEVQVYLDVDDPEYYKDLESVFLEINQKLVPFFITRITISKQIAIVKFEDIDSIEDAERLKSVSTFLPLDFLPPLKEDEFYFHDIIGYKIIDNALGQLGEVEDVISLPNHEIFSFQYEGKEILAPLNDEVIKEINHEDKTLQVSLPDGLMDIYLNP